MTTSTTLRDTFAASALTGLLANHPVYGSNHAPKRAYELADAMLRERGTAIGDNCPTGNQREMECPVTKAMPKEKRAEVSDGMTLTDEEREAIRVAILEMGTLHSGEFVKADTLRNLLARLA